MMKPLVRMLTQRICKLELMKFMNMSFVAWRFDSTSELSHSDGLNGLPIQLGIALVRSEGDADNFSELQRSYTDS